MTNQISTQAITFYGSELVTLKVENVIYTAVRPIVEALGLSWSTQKRKLDNSMNKFKCVHMNTVAEDGKIREMLCMPIRKLNGWLFSINPEKVRPDLKEKVICYQEECFEALYNYWNKPKQQTFPLAEAEADEEAIRIIANLYHSLRGAFEMGEKIRKQHPYFAKEIDKTIGGHYLYNLNHPTEQALEKAKRYVHAKSERIMFIKGMLSLLDEQPQPKRLANF
ncbi:phage antirepressor N-terminal domain-containing protein [Gallibacterium genomosp. 1]|uniref:phage antirepressor N-terminal domain-containing protein n=1 Tax=Gallibacterium genomosp. 1 TaxID=155515 RepID=UPI0009F5F1F1|nr:phage antirepressor N-terminal domain-containing protein [Gallibacterium genomosp. 1]